MQPGSVQLGSVKAELVVLTAPDQAGHWSEALFAEMPRVRILTQRSSHQQQMPSEHPVNPPPLATYYSCRLNTISISSIRFLVLVWYPIRQVDASSALKSTQHLYYKGSQHPSVQTASRYRQETGPAANPTSHGSSQSVDRYTTRVRIGCLLQLQFACANVSTVFGDDDSTLLYSPDFKSQIRCHTRPPELVNAKCAGNRSNVAVVREDVHVAFLDVATNDLIETCNDLADEETLDTLDVGLEVGVLAPVVVPLSYRVS